MKACPNLECPFRKKFGRAGEYQDVASACSDCGAELVAATAPAPQEASRAPFQAEANRQLAVTVAFVAGLFVLARLPLLGLSQSVAGTVSGEQRLLSVGVLPIAMAFTWVEVLAWLVPPWRRARVGGPAARRSIDRAAWLLGVVVLLVRLWQSVDGLERDGLRPGVFVWVQYALAYAAIFVGARLASRHGLAHGVGLVMPALALAFAVEGTKAYVAPALASGTRPGPLVLFVAAVAATIIASLWFAKTSRPGAGLTPTTAPFPVSGVWWSVMAPLLLAPFQALIRDQALYSFVFAFIAIDLVVLAGWLSFRPVAVGRIWAHWVRGVDETGVVVAARRLLPRALTQAVTMTAAAIVLLTVLGQQLELAGTAVLMVTLLTAALATLDVVEAWQATARHGPMTSVWAVQRVAEVEPIAHLLQREGVTVFWRSLHVRASQQFFGPWLPVEAMVPTAQAEKARDVFERHAA